MPRICASCTSGGRPATKNYEVISDQHRRPSSTGTTRSYAACGMEAPLIDDDGELIYRKRGELSIQDMQRFGAFLDRDRERRERALRGPGQESEN
jgi:hypothetical protein